MEFLANVSIAIVAILHAYFMVLEMFLWTKPLGRRIFAQSEEDAKKTAVLAANQGLYNGFLAAGLGVSLFLGDPAQSSLFKVFFLSCVIVAGAYGAWSANKKILWIQAMPALIALILHRLAVGV